MLSSTSVVEIAAYCVLDLDVCPPVQQDLSGLDVTPLGGYVECGEPTLSETQTQKRQTESWNENKYNTNPIS